MKLIKVRVQNYKSILDSGWVEMDDVTCLVGKNESGKTAFLQALEKLNPVEPDHADFNFVYDYPTSKYTAYKRVHKDDPATVVEAELEITPAALERVAKSFGADAVTSKTFTMTKTYANAVRWGLLVDEAAAAKHLATRLAGGSGPLVAAAAAATDGPSLVAAIEAHGAENASAATLRATINGWPSKSIWQGVARMLKWTLPRFLLRRLQRHAGHGLARRPHPSSRRRGHHRRQREAVSRSSWISSERPPRSSATKRTSRA